MPSPVGMPSSDSVGSIKLANHPRLDTPPTHGGHLYENSTTLNNVMQHPLIPLELVGDAAVAFGIGETWITSAE